ncbi:MAG: flagellar biosynthetic protein FliR [Actinomycetota bacterium]|nr:flagellar biosynthetic protein FliR [Actinomycetota bacterium]
MDILQPDGKHLLTFLLVLTRVSGVFFLAPILGNRNIPVQVKIGLALMTSLALFPFVASPNISPSINMINYALLIAKEFTVGAIIGFTASMVFMGFLLAGQIIDFQMGFGMVNVIDPLSNISISLIGQFKNLLALLVFLAINGHYFLLTALDKSFDIVPLTTFAFTPAVTGNFINMVVNMFIIGLKIGGPAIGVLFITDLAIGIVARTVPQMNVFIVGIPLKIAIAFATLIAMLTFFFVYVERIFGQMPEQLLRSIR